MATTSHVNMLVKWFYNEFNDVKAYTKRFAMKHLGDCASTDGQHVFLKLNMV